MDKVEFYSNPLQPQGPTALGGAGGIVSVEYEVFGNPVQGCYYTKYLKEFAEQRGCGGWVKNSKSGTIVGKLQGPRHSTDEVVQWMSKTGSPGSKIERVDLKNWEFMAKQEFRNFSIRF